MAARRSFAAALGILVVWTVAIKYALPVAAARREGVPLGTYVMWDAWPLAHLALAWTLLRPSARAWHFALGVAVAEILVVGTKFAMFLSNPHWTFWTTHWFVNKCAVLALFVAMAGWLIWTPGGRALKAAS
jgi:hypothetical protein